MWKNIIFILLGIILTRCNEKGTERKNVIVRDRTANSVTTSAMPYSTLPPVQISGPDSLVEIDFEGAKFQIFKYEATIQNFKAASVLGAAPKVNISFSEAQAACSAGGYRLCTKSEWQLACKGPQKYTYGFTNTVSGPPDVATTCDVARTTNNTPGSLPSAAGSHSNCKTTGFEIYDMIGNASEWTMDGGNAIAAGAAFYQTAADSNCDAELTDPGVPHMPPETVSSDMGFRCCK